MQTAIVNGGVDRSANIGWGISRAQADWLTDYLPDAEPNAPILSIAAGNGRSARAALSKDHKVFIVDRDVDGLLDLTTGQGAVIMRADIEEKPWPFPAEFFCAALISRPLPRHAVEAAADSVVPGGTVILDLDADVVGSAGTDRRVSAELMVRWLAGRFDIVADLLTVSAPPADGLNPRLVARKRSVPVMPAQSEQPEALYAAL